MKCTKCESDMADGAKFCGGCGQSAPAVMTKCSDGHDNADGIKFCGECGVPMLKAVQEEYDANLDALEVMVKSTTDAPATFELPAQDEGDPDIEKLIANDAMLKAEGLDLPEGTEAMDPMALLKAVVAGARSGGDATREALQLLGNEVVAIGQRQHAMLKAEVSIMRAIKALDGETLQGLSDEIATLTNRPNPRKAVLTPHLKSEGPAAQEPASDTSPKGPMLKAAALEARRGGALTGDQVSEVEMYANRGMTLDQINDIDRGVASALTSFIKSGETAH